MIDQRYQLNVTHQGEVLPLHAYVHYVMNDHKIRDYNSVQLSLRGSDYIAFKS